MLFAAVVAAAVGARSLNARADDIHTNLHHHGDDDITLEERQHLRADQLRRRAQEDLSRRLGYPDVYPYEFRRDSVDYFALSQQIARLAAMLDAMGERTAAAERLAPMSALDTGGGAGGDVARLYGPEGPTPKSVKLLLEYRLMVAGNPRLKVGEITDEGDAVRAEVVTVEDSLVDAYRIDKATGAWELVR